MESRVKWFNNEKGFGFLENNGKEDIFVHYSQIVMDGYKTLKEGQFVSFNLVETPKGLQAKNVEAIREYAVIN
ncbi:MAG: cold-shock protein [bacterium]|nr:cold-shock protein [bacterium]